MDGLPGEEGWVAWPCGGRDQVPIRYGKVNRLRGLQAST